VHFWPVLFSIIRKIPGAEQRFVRVFIGVTLSDTFACAGIDQSIYYEHYEQENSTISKNSI